MCSVNIRAVLSLHTQLNYNQDYSRLDYTQLFCIIHNVYTVHNIHKYSDGAHTHTHHAEIVPKDDFRILSQYSETTAFKSN